MKAHSLEGYDLVVRCDNCGGARWVVYGVALEQPLVHPVQCRCRDCGLVFTSPRLQAERIRGLYDRFYREWAPEELTAEHEEELRRSARGILRALDGLAPVRRLLDVGCGAGILLDEARAAGYGVAGVEIAGERADLARTRFGLDVRQSTLEEAGFADEEFGAAVAWHVLEHVYDLDSFIAELRRVLVRGGALVVGTEGYDYPANRVLRGLRLARGRLPRAMTSTVHTFVFSKRALRDCFERRGFAVHRIEGYDELDFVARIREVGAASALGRVGAKSVTAAAAAAARVMRTGPYLRAVFVRR